MVVVGFDCGIAVSGLLIALVVVVGYTLCCVVGWFVFFCLWFGCFRGLLRCVGWGCYCGLVCGCCGL